MQGIHAIIWERDEPGKRASVTSMIASPKKKHMEMSFTTASREHVISGDEILQRVMYDQQGACRHQSPKILAHGR